MDKVEPKDFRNFMFFCAVITVIGFFGLVYADTHWKPINSCYLVSPLPPSDNRFNAKCVSADSRFLIGKRRDDTLVQSLVKNHSHLIVYDGILDLKTNGSGETILYIGTSGTIEKVGCL